MAVFVSPDQPSMLVMDGTGVLATFRGGQCVTDDPRALAVLAVTPGVRRLPEAISGPPEVFTADSAPLVVIPEVPEDGGGHPDAGPPPQVGPGSSRHAWRAYARDHRVSVPDDVERAACIEACRRAGVRVT